MNSILFRNGKVAKNGLAVAALTNGQSNPDGTLHERELKWLLRRAKGGWGIVNSAAVHVQANGKGWEGEWGCFNDSHTDGYCRAAKAIQAEGSLFLVQLFHGGMRADDKLIEGYAQSAVDTTYKSRAATRSVKGLAAAEIEELVQAFVSAARRVEAAGADGIEIHGAHGYILTQFQCPTLNTREDEWGGCFENRVRLTREVVRRIRATVSPKFIVGVRLSPEPGMEKAGWNVDPDETIQLAKLLCDDGVDFISVSLWRHCPTHITKKHKERSDAKPIMQLFREACPKDIIVMGCGRMSSGEDVRALEKLGVDVAVFGTTAIGDPDFPKMLQKDRNYKALAPPFSTDYLVSVDVSLPFVQMLDVGFGMVRKAKL